MSSLKLTSLYICVVFLSLIAVVHSKYILNPEIHRYVKQHKEVATWDEAKKLCENEGAILASPVDAQLLKYMKSVITTNNHTTPYFIGIKAKLDEKASFVSQEGVLLEDMPKALDLVQQLDSRNGGCLCMDAYSIRVVQCWTRLPYICYNANVTEEDVTTTEKPTTTKIPTTTETPTTTGTHEDCNTGYNYASMTKRYYKFYDGSHATSWSTAEFICKVEGGYLAIPITSFDAELITYPLHAYNWSLAYTGIRDFTGNNDWTTVHGKPYNNTFTVNDPEETRGKCRVLRHDAWGFGLLHMLCHTALRL